MPFQIVQSANQIQNTDENVPTKVFLQCMSEIDSQLQGLLTRLGDVSTQANVTTRVLTDNSGGTISNTIASISDSATKNAVASIVAQLNRLIAMYQAMAKVRMT